MKSSCTGATATGPNRRCAPCRALERRSRAIWPAWIRRANWLLRRTRPDRSRRSSTTPAYTVPEQGVATQVWLAISEDPGAKVSGRYFYRKRTQPAHAAASDVPVQDAFLAACEQLTGVRLPTEVTK